jgi:hypothetical protein
LHPAFFKPNKINFLQSNRVLDRKPDRVTDAKLYVFALYKMAFHFLIFNLERHQRELFSPGQLQWLLPTTRFTRKKRAKKSPRFVYILTDFGTTQLTINNIFLSVFYLIFVFELFSLGQLQWLLPPMEVAKLQHPTKLSTLCQYEYNIINGQKIVSNINNNNKASNAKIGQNVIKAGGFFACFFRVNYQYFI